MKKQFLLGLFAGFLFTGCVSATFAYKFYYPEFLSYEGKLLGKKPADDLDGKICERDIQGNSGCVVMLKSEFQALYTDYLDLQNKLIRCENP
jgi:hypothetical protein